MEKLDCDQFVEIPINEDSDQMQLQISAIQNHPLMEIAESPGHLLLLKLFQREERIYSSRISLKETKTNSIKQEISQLCTFYFFFHMLCLAILFASTLNNPNSCTAWWIPSVGSLSFSMVLIFLVQVRIYKYWKVWKQMEKLRTESRGLSRCVVELRMKGWSFDLGKGAVVSGRKTMKSSSVEVKWGPVSWASRNLIVFVLICLTGVLVPTCKLILCS
ncbi:hypothetical protein QQ045_007960 [Rhodiola kirilowii]